MNFGSGGTFSGRIKAGLSVNPKTLEQSLKSDGKQEMSEQAKMAASRIPEIQMLSRFYGLIPKKFLISQKIQPSVPVLRQKSTIRPTTAKPSKQTTMNRVNSTADTEQNGKLLQRRASVDETKTDTDLPLVTRRISLERSPQKVNFKIPASVHTPERSPEVTDPVMEPLPSMPPQRIIKIDLSQLKWEEVNAEDPHHKSPPEKPKQLSGTVSAQKQNSGSGKPEPAKPKPEQENHHWTAGMTTAERRAKFGRAFSIHPSFSNMSVEEEDDDDGAESDCVPYGDSMIKTGRRSLHVEGPPEDVDTMVSSSRKGRSKSMDDAQLRQDLKTTATVVAMTPKFAVPNCAVAKSKKPDPVQTKVNDPANVEIRPKIHNG